MLSKVKAKWPRGYRVEGLTKLIPMNRAAALRRVEGIAHVSDIGTLKFLRLGTQESGKGNRGFSTWSTTYSNVSMATPLLTNYSN